MWCTIFRKRREELTRHHQSAKISPDQSTLFGSRPTAETAEKNGSRPTGVVPDTAARWQTLHLPGPGASAVAVATGGISTASPVDGGPPGSGGDAAPTGETIANSAMLQKACDMNNSVTRHESYRGECEDEPVIPLAL